MLVTSEQVIVWAKRIEPQRAQTVVINSVIEVKDCDEIHARKSEQNRMKLHVGVKCLQGKCKYCSSCYPPR